MSITQVIGIAFAISFLGSIPPGTVNISVMQLSVQGHRKAAVLLALGASLVEWFYAGITVYFQQALTRNESLQEAFHIITAFALILIGILNLKHKSQQNHWEEVPYLKGRVGFKKGLFLGLLNPLTIPFWLLITHYLVTHNLVIVTGNFLWYYISGLAIGTFILLLIVERLGRRFQSIANNTFLVYKIPGILFIIMGVYNLLSLF